MTESDPTQPTEDELRAVAERIRSASAEVRAPAALRERIAAGGADRTRPAPVARRPWWTRWPALGLAGAAVAAVLFVVVSLPGADPTVAEAAEIASLEPTEPAPAQDPAQPTLLAANFEGLSYPDWAEEFGWRAAGERSDDLDGRSSNTVFYESDDGKRIAYTIVSGEPLDAPDDGRPAEIEGVRLESFTADGTPAVTWLRDGHTCVLAGDGVEESTLLELAAWKGDGAVAF